MSRIFSSSTPKVPKPVAQANAPIAADAGGLPSETTSAQTMNPSSLISTSVAGLRRKPNTQKASLIGGV